MISRLVRYWLEMVPGTRTGRAARACRDVVGRCPSLVDSQRGAEARSASTRSLLGRLRMEMWPSMTVTSGAAPRMASMSRVVTALCPTSSSTRPGGELAATAGDAARVFGCESSTAMPRRRRQSFMRQ